MSQFRILDHGPDSSGAGQELWVPDRRAKSLYFLSEIGKAPFVCPDALLWM